MLMHDRAEARALADQMARSPCRLSLSDASKKSLKVPPGGTSAIDSQNLTELVTRNRTEVDKIGTRVNYPSWQHTSSKSSAAFRTSVLNQLYAVAVACVMYVSVYRMILRSMRMHPFRACISSKYIHT
jgi:hypothetical protein